MTTKNQNFEMVAGDSKNVIVTVSDADLTGATIKWAMKRSVSSATANVSKDTTSGGISISDATGGIFTISLIPADTSALKGDFYHEAEITDAQNNVSTVMTGRISILPSGV
jgi:hypothetical protein